MELLTVAEQFGVPAESSRSGRWVRFRGARGDVCVMTAAWNAGYLLWYDAPDDRQVESYYSAQEAICAALGVTAGDAVSRQEPAQSAKSAPHAEFAVSPA